MALLLVLARPLAVEAIPPAGAPRTPKVALLLFLLAPPGLLLESGWPLLGRRRAVIALAVLIPLANAWFGLPGLLGLMAIPTALAAPSIGVLAATALAVGESLLLLCLARAAALVAPAQLGQDVGPSLFRAAASLLPLASGERLSLRSNGRGRATGGGPTCLYTEVPRRFCMGMTDRERVFAVLEGRPVDRFPVAVPYIMLLQCDHWCELTGRPAWTWYEWLHQDPAEHVRVYEDFDRQLPFDILQPQRAPSRAQRESARFVHQDGQHYRRDQRTGEMVLLNEDLPNSNAAANEARSVFDRADVRRLIEVRPAERILEDGHYDFVREAARLFGGRKFLMNGVTGTFWQCTFYLGETNLFLLLHEDPGLIEYLSDRLLERTIEEIRALAAASHDAIYVDDALTTNDMISVAHYERFSLPRVRAMVEEIHRLGKKAVLIYFGGVADRIPQILSLGADSLQFEATMKSYVNDLDAIQRQVGDRLCLWGNLDPVGLVQEAGEEELRQAIAGQVAIGRRVGRFIVSTGSPITPLTPLARIRRYIELGWEVGAASNR